MKHLFGRNGKEDMVILSTKSPIFYCFFDIKNSEFPILYNF